MEGVLSEARVVKAYPLMLAAVAPDLQRHVANGMRDRAAILKEARKAKEEQKLRRGPKGGGKTDASGSGGQGG